MSQEPSNNKSPRFGPRFPFVVTAIVLFILFGLAIVLQYQGNANVGFLIGVLALFLVLTFWRLIEEDGVIQQDKDSRREHRRQQAIKKERATFEAQLRKPDFETRLHSFTRTDGKNEDDNPESQMEFWERNEDYSRTPTRPIELIRSLLQRISKLVGMR